MKLNDNFYLKSIVQMNELIDQSMSFTVMGVRDFGRSAFLKKFTSLESQNQFVLVDIYDLAEYSRINVLRLMAKKLSNRESLTLTEEQVIDTCQNALTKLLTHKERVVIILNRIDLVSFKLDDTFFATLRSLLNVDPQRISFIFGTCQKINVVASEQISGSSILFFSRIHYLPLFSKDDLILLANDFGINISDRDMLERAVTLSGGHLQLFQLLMKKNFAHNSPIKDEFILLALKSIYANLTPNQKQIVRQVASGKAGIVDDEYLIGTGMVQKTTEGFTLFSSLFSEFVQSYASAKLPVKEKKLFKVLKTNINSVVTRAEIFNSVWGVNNEDATDWALDALVYRLRRNKVFQNSGFAIENHKKQGYSLISG